MQTFFLVSLFIFWSIFGSFASVVIWRIHGKESGILTGRSRCPRCQHTLGALDLFPIFSYLFLRGKCRFCQAPISGIYPLLELASGLLFMFIGMFLVDFDLLMVFNMVEMARLALFCSAAFVTIVFVFYDILFMEIPDEIILPFILILLGLLTYHTWHSSDLFGYFQAFESPLNPLMDWLLGSWIIYTFFYLQILIPWSLHAHNEKKSHIFKTLLAEYFIFPVYIFVHLFKKSPATHEEPPIPAWIGGWDLRIALFMGLFAGTKIALLWVALGYVFGSAIGVFLLIKSKDRSMQVPFGPYLALGLWIALCFYSPIIDWYQAHLIIGT